MAHRRYRAPQLVSVLHGARRFVPAEARARIRQLLFQWLGLTWTLPTGVRIRIDDYAEWIIYNEIFVSGEYDQALTIAGESRAGGPFQVVDLGANVGFFTLRAVDHLRRCGLADGGFAITAVEANAASCAQFRARVLGDNALGAQVTLVEGAVGHRTGSATLYENSIVGSTAPHGHAVPFSNLSSLLAAMPRIDLLKCDIEGAEALLIENYPDLFGRVRVAVFELHRRLCDTERCKARLREYGFTNAAMPRESEADFTYLVWR